MKASSQTEMPFGQALLGWVADRFARIMAAIKPEHRAVPVAVRVAARGNRSRR